MKKLVISLIFVLIFTLTACEGDSLNYDYVASGLTVDSETLYYREYTVDTDCETFDVFPIYENNNMYTYLEAHKSMSDACSSSLYVETSEGHIDVYYAFNTGVYDVAQLQTTLSSVTTSYESVIVPSEVTLAALLEEIIDLDKQTVLADAVAFEAAADLYCVSNICNSTEELSWNELGPLLNDIDRSMYEFTDTDDIVIKTSNSTSVTLERVGTGEYEFPAGNDPSETSVDDIVVDGN